MSNIQDNRENRPILCQKHGLAAYDICLHGAPMKGRLLCKICKGNLEKEELLEVISLTDFISRNFMTALDSMVKDPQARNGSPDKDPLEKHIEYFFEKLEESVIDVIRNGKENALKAARESKANTSAAFDIEYHRSFVNTKLEDVLQNWERNLYEDALLDDFSKQFAELSKNVTVFLSKSSTHNQRKDAIIESLKVDGKYVTHLQDICEKHVEKIIHKIKPAAPKEDSSTIEIEESKENGTDGRKSGSLVTRNKRRIQAQIDKEEKADKVEKKIKPSAQTNGKDSSEKSNSGEEIVVEINEEPRHSQVSTMSKLRCTDKIYTKHEGISWGGLCFIESKNHLVTGGYEGKITVWDVDTKQSVCTRDISSKVYKMVYVKERDLLLVSSNAGSVHIFDVKKGYALLLDYQIHPKQAFSVAYLTKMDLIASCGEEGNIILWGFNKQKGEATRHGNLDTNKKQVSCLYYIEDLNLLVAGMYRGGHIQIFQPDRSKCIRVVKAHDKERSVDSLVYVPEWKQLISGAEDGYIKFWDFSDMSKTDSPHCLKSLRREESFIESIAVIPEENSLFHTNVDEYFSAWDLSQDKLVENYRGHTKDKTGEALLYLKNRRELVTSFGEEIRFWTLGVSKK